MTYVPAREISRGDTILLGSKLCGVSRAWHHESGYIIAVNNYGRELQYRFENRDAPIMRVSRDQEPIIGTEER